MQNHPSSANRKTVWEVSNTFDAWTRAIDHWVCWQGNYQHCPTEPLNSLPMLKGAYEDSGFKTFCIEFSVYRGAQQVKKPLRHFVLDQLKKIERAQSVIELNQKIEAKLISENLCEFRDEIERMAFDNWLMALGGRGGGPQRPVM